MTERDKQAAKPATRTGDRRHHEAASSRGAGPRADELAQLLETMADWLWETDVEHRFVWLSEHFAERTGYDPARVIGKSRRDLLAVEASQDVEQHLADMEAHRPFRDFVYHSAVMPQQCSWISVSGYPLFDGDGAFLGYRGGARNVTGVVQAFQALDQARDELQERERREAQLLDAAKAGESNAERLMAALNVIEDAVCYYDADDRLILYNEAFLTLYSGMAGAIHIGASFEELLDEGIKSRFFDTDGVSAEEWRSGALAKRRREQQAQHVLRLNDGRWLMRRLMRTADGGVIEICTDVSELKQRERALSDANAQASELLADLQRTVDAMRMGVVVVNGAMHAEIINKAFYDIWKVTPGDVSVGSPFRRLMDVNRHNGIYDIPDERWESYVEGRLDEIRAGPVAPREFRRADGLTMIYSVTELSGGKRLITYYDVSEIKNREKELARALERAGLADAVLNAVEDPIFVKDAELRYVFANEAFATHFGTTPAEMIGKTASHFATPAEAGRFELSERRVVASGVAFEAEEDFQANGATRTRIVRKSRVRMASGKDYVAGFLFDITDTKRREIEADEARHRLESVIESMPAGVIIYDRSNRYVLGNRLVKETLPALADAMQPGVPLRVALETAHAAGYFRTSGDTELDALYDSDPAAWVDLYSKRYEVRDSVSERLNTDGKWHKVFDTRTADGTYIGIRVDITEIKEREEALRQSMRENELFRNLVDNVPVAIYAKREDLKLVYVNRGWSELTGYSQQEAIGRTDIEIFGPEGEAFMEGDREVMRIGATLEIEETATAPDGVTRYQIARKSAMIASDGSLHLIGSTTDITELKQRERELEEAQRRAVLADRAKSEFLANMSHEIRTPMNGVLGMAELLAKSELDPKQKTFTDIIVKSGNALLTIINDILDFSKIDAGQLVLDPAPFHLAEAIEDVATLVSTRAKEKDLELIVRIQPGLPDMFVGDVGRIRQVITNLLGNAVKFTDSGHVLIDVTGEPAGGSTRLRIAVTDTGIGIPEDKLRLVFEKFSQVDASSTRRHEGTGLGLAITSRLIDLMDGSIDVTSTEGDGSTFTVEVTLPNASQTGKRKHAPLDVTGARILIVDDNQVNRAILMEQMASWSFDACAAENGPEGLKVLQVAKTYGLSVDCVILDYQMPGMTGAEVARLVRSDPALADTPIILLTSVDQSLSNQSYRELEIDAHLIKPARASALLDAMVTTIQRSRARRNPSLIEPVARPQALQQTRVSSAPPIEAPAAAAPAPSKAGGGDHRVDILVAEDNEVNQLVFTQILSETPYTFEIVGNGRLALESCAAMKPRMILMDVSMPQMNGLEATAAIREQERAEGRHVPIVGVTAHALKGDRERCLEAGMDDYLSKPISPNALLTKIERWIGEGVEPGRQAG